MRKIIKKRPERALEKRTGKKKWKLRRQESNLRPPGYEPGELTAAPRRDYIVARGRSESSPASEMVSGLAIVEKKLGAGPSGDFSYQDVVCPRGLDRAFDRRRVSQLPQDRTERLAS